jgi:hypothetical protein
MSDVVFDIDIVKQMGRGQKMWVHLCGVPLSSALLYRINCELYCKIVTWKITHFLSPKLTVAESDGHSNFCGVTNSLGQRGKV